MKKVFTQIRQWILRHKKRLIYGGLAFLVIQIFFFNLGDVWIGNEVFADGEQNDTATQNVNFKARAAEKFQDFAFIQKVIYLLIYPMLVIAGSLVDNSLVYWEVFGFDVALWELWNIMRNLANFTLWFIFVYKIFKYLIPGKKKEDIKILLRSLLIAGLGIQASWFIMAALIDASTILAYWIWWLPVSVLKDVGITGKTNEWDKNELKNNPYILKTVINADVDDIDIVHIYLTNTPWEKEHYISECETVIAEKRELLLAPKMIYFEKPWNNQNPTSTYIETESGKCHYGGQVYQFGGWLYNRPEKCKDKDDCKDKQGKYTTQLSNIKNELSHKDSTEIIPIIADAKLLEQWNAHITGGVRWWLWNWVYPNSNQGLDVDNGNVGKEWNSKRLNDILNGESYVWIFTQLYSSLIRTWQWIITNAWWEYSALLAIAISLWHLIAIAIPLIVVWVVFMIRIWILWIAIAISPFIALFAAFEDLWKELKERIKFLDYFNLENLIGIIFAPALICLAISLSTVLVTIITNLNYPWDWEDKILWWLVVLDIAWVSAVIRRFIISIFWIAITWFLVRTAVESSKLWKIWFIWSLKKLAETSIWSIPIVPIPWKKGEWIEYIWANTAFGLNGQRWMLSTISDKIQTEFNGKDNEAIEEFINGGKASQEAVKNRASSYTSKLVNLPASEISTNRTTQPIKIWEKWNEIDITFNMLNDKQKEDVIQQINKIKDDNVRKAFWNSQGEITIWNDRYEFKDGMYKKDEKTWK